MDVLVKKLIGDNPEEFSKDIDTFHRDYGCRTVFQELNANNLREKLWQTIFNYVSDDSRSSSHHACLSALRILSRDETNLDQIVTRENLEVILDIALLSDKQKGTTNFSNVTVEALKLLCNLLFQSTKVQQLLPQTSCLSHIIQRMRDYSHSTPYEIKLFDSRIIFLITALNVPMRKVVKSGLCGDSALIKLLHDICKGCQRESNMQLNTEDVTLVCEIFKALFNLYINANETDDADKGEMIGMILYKLLTAECKERKEELQSQVANLLTIVPLNACVKITPVPSENSRVVFQNIDMTAISVLLGFLDQRLNCKEDLVDNLSPIVSAFIRLVKARKSVRRYVRLQVLPPLKDASKRPEEGTTLRAKLCKLLTFPVTELRDLVAEFLFILCKENVTRMIKYTGYGNAAGMFAKKGLLGATRSPAHFSSESEDSDTEEYEKLKELINPVTGCVEAPKPNPLDGMTEEQKEYAAMQLVDLVDKLTRSGMVQPCRIGEDGKPKPIGHVLELQDELPKKQVTRRDSDSD